MVSKGEECSIRLEDTTTGRSFFLLRKCYLFCGWRRQLHLNYMSYLNGTLAIPEAFCEGHAREICCIKDLLTNISVMFDDKDFYTSFA